jgi:hypothetical protein
MRLCHYAFACVFLVGLSVAAAQPKKSRVAKPAASSANAALLEPCRLWLVTRTPAPGFSGSAAAVDFNSDCAAYFGETQNGLPHGRGSWRVFGNGKRDSYEGQFQNGKFHGQGKLWERGGQGYSGEFAAGEKHGRGKEDHQYYTYEGEFTHGKWSGRGLRITWSDRAKGIERERYEGEFVDGEPHGHGVYTEKSADKLLYRYEGGWKNGKHDGKGIEFDGRWYKYAEGTYVNGTLKGEGYRVFWGTGATRRYQLQSGVWDGSKLVEERPLSWRPTEPQYSTYVPRFDSKQK